MLLRTAIQRLSAASAGQSASRTVGRSARTLAPSSSPFPSFSLQKLHLANLDSLAAFSPSSTQPSSFQQRRFMSNIPSAPPAQQVHAFPSLVINSTLNSGTSTSSLTPQGSFAEAQAAFLSPPKEIIQSLFNQLVENKIGIVAHYYMDVELQGVLHGVKRLQMELLKSGDHKDIPTYPLVTIADSLAMGDHAVSMCTPISEGGGGVNSIICLGVDFMSESVAAIMGRNSYGHVPVYRATMKHIGCSLAESAEGRSYRAWLQKFGDDEESNNNNPTEKKKALHVVYINTSLETKAISSSIIPTITCTSSNVLQTILQASAQMGPVQLQICYGPDTYMGENLRSLLDAILGHSELWSDERISKELHPQHSRKTLAALRDNLHVYPSGNCIVHHMFGSSVVQTVLDKYSDAYVTAHLEVPGEMFQIALQKSMNDEGVVGSTSNILQFIERKVEEAAKSNTGGEKRRLKFILGTEAGMVTSIVRSVQDILDANQCQNVEAEIIFPVSSDAVMGVDDNDSSDLGVVPGVAGGEGCSTAGGCATCPFMKMNDLDAVHDLIDMIQSSSDNMDLQLQKHLPPNRLQGKTINGRNAIELGSESIVFMRHFMKEKVMNEDLVQRIERMVQ